MRRGWAVLAVLVAIALYGDWLVMAAHPTRPTYRCWVWDVSHDRELPDPACTLWAWEPENYPQGYQDEMWGSPSDYLRRQEGGPKA